jgi:CelD/BcsL family acetyltransferase involved in cellulose biosynthesis
MTMDGDDIAFGYALVAHKKLDLRWIAFKLKYESSLSFGKVLTMWMIRDACQDGIESFDFGFGDSEFKQFWATDNHDVVMAVAGRGVLGYLIVLCYRAMWRLAENKWLFSLYRRFRKWRSRLK